MVPSVQVHVVGVKQKVGKQEHHHFNGVFPTIYKIPIKHVRRLSRRKSILKNVCFSLRLNLIVFDSLLSLRCKDGQQLIVANFYLIKYEK